MGETKPKRRWFRFSLRTFFVLVTVFCIWLGWNINAARQQRQAVEAIREIGGTVSYDYEFDSTGNPLNPSPEPGWLTKWLGVDFFHHVVAVRLYDSRDESHTLISDYHDILPHLRHLTRVDWLCFGPGNLQDDDLKYIAPLTSLELLEINNNEITGTGFKYLTGKKLTELRIFEDPINDEGLKSIARFSNLEILFLEMTNVTDVGLTHLAELRNLKILNLPGNLLTDQCIQSLSQLPNLTGMSLDHTGVTADGVQKLAELKPSVSIACAPEQSPPAPATNISTIRRYMRSRDDWQKSRNETINNQLRIRAELSGESTQK